MVASYNTWKARDSADHRGCVPSAGSRSWSSENPDDEVPPPPPPLLLPDSELVEHEVDRFVLEPDVIECDVVWELDVVDELCFSRVFVSASLPGSTRLVIAAV